MLRIHEQKNNVFAIMILLLNVYLLCTQEYAAIPYNLLLKIFIQNHFFVLSEIW